ncbi:MAG: asparagine synthase-related protein, partial [Chitinophagaceae bacterium]
EFCIALPEKLKISNTDDKILMRESFKHLWTDDITRRHKQGFGAPMNQWLMQKEMQQLKNDFLLDSNNKMYEWLDYKTVSAYAAKDNYQTWLLLTLAVWMQRHR